MIALRLKVQKNINELTSEEVKSIIWVELSNEQYKYVDADVYRKLNAEGRAFVNNVIENYNSRPIEYWNEVFKHPLKPYVADRILNISDNATEVYNNHKDVFDKYAKPRTLFECGVLPFADFVRKLGIEAVTESCSYIGMLSPAIPIEQYNQKYDDEMTILQFIKNELEEQWSTNDYPILLPNAVLVAGGYPCVPNFSEATLNAVEACEEGRLELQPWIQSLGKDGVLGWDTVVAYLRENPEEFDAVEEYLEWWWNNNVE